MPVSDDDRKAFEEATRDVRRLKSRNKAESDKQRPKPKARQTRAARAAVLEQSLTGPLTLEAGDEVAFRRDQVTDRTFRRLKRGEFVLEAEIDLHGMRLAEAKAALKAFIGECAARQIGCVRVIHGKGTRSGPAGPILKPSVHQWLAQYSAVLAFVSAAPRHGGSGAVCVLLRGR